MLENRQRHQLHHKLEIQDSLTSKIHLLNQVLLKHHHNNYNLQKNK
jgi:hypothetical protein